ncbi:hypothetical protein IFM89_013467 [Coptis chinensis]|uniref:Uncharacterized protein n=1 Tax=Coptis chinensis TaxID=261450 RepID=A0A835HJM4_9MAGN|nr:hypothetical protein IFM89_013467 [Coptis chinensis]
MLIEDSADDIEVNKQGEQINVVNEPVNIPSTVNVQLLDENMSLTTTLPASGGENVEGGIASGHPQVEPEICNGNSSSPVDNIITLMHAECDMQDMREGCRHSSLLDPGRVCLLRNTEALPTSVDMEDVLVKKRSETIDQAAPISVDEAVGSTGCHPQSPPPDVTTVESTRDCGMDELLQPDYNVTMEYRKYQRKYPQKKKTSKETNALPTQLGAMLPFVSRPMSSAEIREPGTKIWEEAKHAVSRM